MKKKKLNHLSLKKRTISNLNGSQVGKPQIIGGSGTCGPQITTWVVSQLLGCTNNCPTPSRGCETDTCEETFTCPDWSCECQ